MIFLVLLLIAWPTAAQQGPQLRREIAASLVTVEGTQLRELRWQHEPELIALYFGADWCGPCHALVPTLIDTRNALRAAGANTEVIYVSQDTSQAQMRHAMQGQGMPWPAINYRRIDAVPALRRLAGQAPPNLVLIDRQGRVRASAWQGRRYLGTAQVMQYWLQWAPAQPSSKDSAARADRDDAP